MSGLNDQFYKDNAPNYDEFKALTSLFKGLTDIFDEVMSQAIDNSKISTMRAFTTIPIQIINVVDACYSLPTLLTNREVLNITGISPELSVYERTKAWNGLDPKIRATALEQMGLVLMLINPNILKGENAYTDTFKVIDFEMYDFNTGDRLIYGLDYYYEYNKIYFLRFGSHTNKYNNKKIILKNITIDNNTPEKILGEPLGIYANSNFSPTEYRDVVTSFASAALAGPVINTMNQSFNPDTSLNLAARTYGLNDYENSLKGIKIVDYKSADDVKKNFWDKQVEGVNRLNIFDFLVTIPSDYLYKAEKMEYVYEFMKKIKPAQSNFVLCPEYFLKDTLPLRYANFSFRSEGEMTGIKDNIKYSERNYRIVYLEHITRMQTNRTQYSASDEIALDTDYFDVMLAQDEFKAITSHETYDVAPKFRTIDFNAHSVQYVLDTGSFEDCLKQKFIVTLVERVSNIASTRNAPVYPTDVGFMLDSILLNDTKVDHQVNSVMSDKLKSKDYAKQLARPTNVIEQIESIESDYRVVYLNHLTRVHVSRKSLHVSDEMQLDTDYFDSILFGDTFKANMETSFYDKASAFEKDNIKYRDSVKPQLLNGDSLCDKISSIDDLKRRNVTGTTDSLSFVSKANVAKCDSIYCCDYEAETSFRLDNESGFHAESNSIGYEVITLRLIPKK